MLAERSISQVRLRHPDCITLQKRFKHLNMAGSDGAHSKQLELSGQHSIKIIYEVTQGRRPVCGCNPAGVQLQGVLDDQFYYEGPLGATLAGDEIEISVWAPTATRVSLSNLIRQDYVLWVESCLQ